MNISHFGRRVVQLLAIVGIFAVMGPEVKISRITYLAKDELIVCTWEIRS